MLMELWNRAEAVVIGAGAGLSTAAGITYSGQRFEENFDDFIDRYGMRDMYSAGFYHFSTQEEKWAYWSRHISLNRYDVPATDLYLDLWRLVQEKEYFVLTTNVDHQFWKAGFPDERIFATQGDYGMFQCAGACHNKLYHNEALVKAMNAQQKDCRIPKYLVPKCPVCGGDMAVNIRCDHFFVEDEHWHEAAVRYQNFLNKNQRKNVLFLELGVGLNTPGIIKYPFWQMTNGWKHANYVCVNKGEAWVPDDIGEKSICLNQDLSEFLEVLKGEQRL